MKNIYTKHGNKNPILVLMHGWGESKETWKDIIPALSEKSTVYALDLPAFGDNQKDYTVFALKDYVAYLNNFFYEHKIEKSILIGHSFGGRVATQFTLQYPKKVEKLVLYSSNIRFDKDSSNRMFALLNSVNKSMVLLFSVITRGVRNKKLSPNDYTQLSTIQKMIHADAQFIDVLHQIKQPVLLLAGRFDFLTTLSYQRTLSKKFVRAKLVTFDRSTHIAHKEERRKFIETIKEFMR